MLRIQVDDLLRGHLPNTYRATCQLPNEDRDIISGEWVSLVFLGQVLDCVVVGVANNMLLPHPPKRGKTELHVRQLEWTDRMQKLRAELGRAPLLEEMLPLARIHRMTREEKKAQRESWVVGELLLDHPELSRPEAVRLYREAVERSNL